MGRESAGLVLVALVLIGCPKSGSPNVLGKGRLELTVMPRTPVQCGGVEKDETLASSRTFAPGGCNAAVRFSLEPSGEVDVDVPFYRGAAPTAVGRRVDADGVVSAQVILRDPQASGRWEVGVPLDRLPYVEGCAPPTTADPTAFDFNAWRFLVVRVRSRDAFGNLSPYVAGRDSSVDLQLALPSGGTIEPEVVVSTEHQGVWAAVWCDQGEIPTDVRFGVRGAYQLETDSFSLPDFSGDTYTVLEYVVEPTGG